MPLLDPHCLQDPVKALFQCHQELGLVVDRDVALSRVPTANVVGVVLFVQKDKDVPPDGGAQSGVSDLLGLKPGVAVRQDDRHPNSA